MPTLTANAGRQLRAEWAAVYEAHEKKVDAVFQSTPDRLLKLDIVEGAAKGQHAKLWTSLCTFLGEDQSIRKAWHPFPHKDVFVLSAWTQVLWQLTNLRKRCRRRQLVLFLPICFARPAVNDHGQCARACRVANAKEVGAPPVLGATGDWFANTVSGRRLLTSPNECMCYSSDTTMSLPHPIVARLHPAIETKDQWHFNTKRVCGADGAGYTSEKSARSNGVDVTNCGQCSRCSSLQSVDAMHRYSTSLTKRASLAAIAYLFFGETTHRMLMRSPLIGFDEPCADCWLAATQCNIASCAQHCLYGWTNPLSSPSTTNGTTDLNACMHCDEIHCSAYFLQSCGANRRTAGVVSDINRPSVHVCTSARHDAYKRAGGPPEQQPSRPSIMVAALTDALCTPIVIIALLTCAYSAISLDPITTSCRQSTMRHHGASY